ncbi:AMP-binding protein [Brevibacillus humidisoli]|uniref:class I adenylate-forming enzyme family protein n=1 Tax=Brevibacillus humidisoli TaxID=2895522 RepID=UPI001E342EB4|nr:AMP-binding protein [Brevibacillus humidisoli]UFJ39226.1 AMP-binding protein [Brevibacillus humidisoli]
MNLSALLATNGRKHGDKEALIDGERRISYREWNQHADYWAARLRQMGIERADRVAIMMPNCLEFAIMYMAIMRSGAIVVPISARSAPEDVSYVCEEAECKGMIVHDQLFAVVAQLPAGRQLRALIKTGEGRDGWLGMDDGHSDPSNREWKALPCDAEVPEFSEDDEVSMLFTSGTTGRPKGVLFTHRNVLTVAKMMAIEMQIDHRSRILQMMPLSHSAPLHLFFHTGIMVAATQVLAPTFSPELLLALAQRERITHFFGAPVAYLLTMKHPDFLHCDLSSAHCWVYGGAPLSKEMAEQIERAFGQDKVVCVYGLTEAGPTGTALRHAEYPDKAGSIGRAVLYTEVEVVNERGEPVPAGEPGEIRIRSEGTMKGYIHNPEATAEVVRDGWVYSGDIARVDEEGFLWVIDRKKDVIISGGVNVYPKEIEQELERHPAIQEVAVVGVPHPEWGETVKACLVLREQAAADAGPTDWLAEVRRFLSGKVADYKLPRLVECLTALPRNASGKVLKHVLREQTEA